MNDSKIIFAADGLTALETVRLVVALGPSLYAVKIHDLYDSNGPIAARMLKRFCPNPNLKVWVDYKLKDAPRTMERRARALVSSGVDIISVYADAGHDGIQAVKESGAIVYAVTILTTEKPEVTRSLTGRSVEDAVLQRAIMAATAGAHGVIASGLEMRVLAEHSYVGRKLERIALGIRQEGDPHDDQCRVSTPAEAMAAGAHRIAVGEPIARASDPLAKLQSIQREIEPMIAA